MDSGLIAGISNIFGASVAAGAQQQTNKMNLQIARENNKAMLDAMREQTKADQTYNSIGAQMQRAMAAGANPMLLAGADPTSVSAAGVPSLDSPVMQNPYQSYSQMGASLGSAALHAEQLALQEKQINVAEFKSKIDMLQTIGELGGSIDWTSSELKGVIRSVFGDTFDADSIGAFARDNMVMTRIKNSIETSNLDKDTKKYLYGWLDEFTNAQYINLLSDTERNQTQSKLNRALESLNREKRDEITQAILNMKEEWNSLYAKGQMDLHKLERFAELFDAELNKIVAETKLTNEEASYLIWGYINGSLGALGGVAGKLFKR